MRFFHFTKVTITASGEIMKFHDKLPAKASLCCGVNMSANTHHATRALALVAVSFNGGKDMTINQPLHVKAAPATKSHDLMVIQPLDANTTVEGYVKDLGNAPAYPYDVKIYFTLNQ